MTKIYIFPGQGSQAQGMGKALFSEFPELTEQADEVLGYSIKQLCLSDPQRLNQTRYTQPALYVVNALTYLKTVRETGIEPDFVAGHSLGEYNALFAAGAFDFATGLRIVKRRGELMSQATGGGMAAVIGLTSDVVRQTLQSNGLNTIDIANLNAPLQTVISGPAADIKAAEPAFLGAGAKMYVVLNVSGAFHSRYMSGIKADFEKLLHEFVFSPLRIPVIANRTARPYRSGEVREQLAGQITDSVRWVETVRYLCSFPDAQLQEIGPGTTLTNLVRHCREYFNQPETARYIPAASSRIPARA